MQTKRSVLGGKEFLVLDQLLSVYTKYVLEAVHPVRDRKVQIHGIVVTVEGWGLLISV